MNPDLIEPPYPLQAHLGFAITDWQCDFCRLELPLAPFLMNRFGIPHGGIYATLLDTAMGFACGWTGDAGLRQQTLTLSLNVNFLTVSEGRNLIAIGRRVGGGRKTAFASGEVRDDTDKVIATASGVFRLGNLNRKPDVGE